MDINWENIITFIGTSSLFLLVLTFFLKALLKHLFDRDKEKFKSDLESDLVEFKSNLQIGLEKHKSELEKERIKLQVSYSTIYAKQAEAIIEIFEVIHLVENMAIITCGDTKESTTYEDFNEAWKKLLEIFRKKRILLPDHVCKSIDELISKSLFGVETDKAYISVLERGNISVDIMDKYINNMEKNRNNLYELTAMKLFLEKEFKKLLSISSKIED